MTNEALRLENLLISTQRQHGIGSGTTASGGQGGQRNWRGIVPYLRVIMSFTQDDVKCPFLARANTRLRQELDTRNSDIR